MMRIAIDAIKVGEKHRKVVPAMVKEITASIEIIGLKTPITVRQDAAGQYWLVAGRHRLEACRKLGHSAIEAEALVGKLDAKMWEIAENLHRADLSMLQRNLLIGRWVKLCAQKMEQNRASAGPIESKRQDGRGHRRESGISAAARKLGVPETTAKRAVRIAADLKEPAQKEAERLGLENHTLALDRAAKHGKVEQQVAYLQDFKAKQIERQRVDLEIKAVYAGTNPPRHAEDAFRQWFRLLGGALKREVRAWLREMDPIALADDLDRLADLTAEDRARMN